MRVRICLDHFNDQGSTVKHSLLWDEVNFWEPIKEESADTVWDSRVQTRRLAPSSQKLTLIAIRLDVVDAGFIGLRLSVEMYMKETNGNIVWSGLTVRIEIPHLSRPTPNARDPMKMRVVLEIYNRPLMSSFLHKIHILVLWDGQCHSCT